MDPIAISITLFKGAAGLVWMIYRKRELKKLRQGGDVEDQEFRRLILTEIDNVSLKVDRKSREKLKTSKSFYKEGMEYLNVVLNNAGIGSEEATKATKGPTRVGRTTFHSQSKTDPTAENLKLLKQARLDEPAKEALSQANEAFIQASIIATYAFNDENLDVSERVEAMYIRLMGKILQNMEHPSNVSPSCRSYLNDLHGLSKIKRIFRAAVTNRGKKSPLSKDEDIKVFVGVCYLHRVIYDHVAQLDSQDRGPWTWPCIKIEESKMIHRIDPLRDARVAEALYKLHEQQAENVLTSVVSLPVVWSFGTEKEKLVLPRDVSTNTKGEFIVADGGDRKIKVFDGSGTFLYSIHPLSRRLADEEVLSVATDREDNLLVLIKIDKHRYEIQLFDKHGKLFHRFRLREGFVRCSPIVNINNEVLVVSEGKESRCSAIEAYGADGQFLCSYGQEILKEPKAMTVADKGNLMILNVDGGVERVLVFDAQGNHLPELNFDHVDVVPSEAIEFHSVTNHVAISNSNISGPGGLVKISVYNQHRECVHGIHQGEEKSERGEMKRVPPKIAVTKDGRIAILAGVVGDSKVIVV